jgi:hypothetical protein
MLSRREVELLERIEHLLREIRDHLIYPLRLIVIGDLMANGPFPLLDNESLPLGLALTGSNPDDLTIASAVWSVDQVVTLEDTPPALTATAVTTPGVDGTATGTVTATLSDGSTLTASFEIDVTAAPVPLALEVVPGTPVPNA